MKSKAATLIACAQSADARSVTTTLEIPTDIHEWLRQVGSARGLTVEEALTEVLRYHRQR